MKTMIKRILQGITCGKFLWRSTLGAGTVCLTFDDGPHPDYTPMILDVLDQYRAKATFFLIGEKVALHPEVARDIVRRGHQIGNHTFRHSLDAEPATFYRDIERCSRVINEATGLQPVLFRPPWGKLNVSLLCYCLRHDLRVVMWSFDSLDFLQERHRGIAGACGGDIILLHDDAPVAVDILKRGLPALAERGFTFAPVIAGGAGGCCGVIAPVAGAPKDTVENLISVTGTASRANDTIT